MPVTLSQRAQRVKPSPTLAVTALAARLKAEGKDIIGLGPASRTSIPRCTLPMPASRRSARALRATPMSTASVELKDAIIAKFKRDNGISYERSQILVSTGAKQTIFNLCMALLDPGDECDHPGALLGVLSRHGAAGRRHSGHAHGGPGPGLQDYAHAAGRGDHAARPAAVPAQQPEQPDRRRLHAAELRALADVLLRHPQILIGTDDMYEKIYWAVEPFASLAQAIPELYDRTVTINGVSKAYAMTGWRIGYCGAPKEIVTAMGTIQGQSTSNASSISQKAATVALNGDQSCVAEMNKAFQERHDFVVAGLNAIPGISCRPGAGTFYAFANVEAAMKALGFADDGAFAEFLLVEGGVAVVPGTGFGAPGHIRISFACSLKTLDEALKRIKRTIEAGRRR